MTVPLPRQSGQSVRVLLVDDDTPNREMMRAILERDGWTVLAARDGAEALEIARDIDYRIDLVISDIVMPVMSGRKLVREMLVERPGLRVLLITGFDAGLAAEDPDTAHLPLLEKPFTPAQLQRAVARAAPDVHPRRPDLPGHP